MIEVTLETVLNRIEEDGQHSLSSVVQNIIHNDEQNFLQQEQVILAATALSESASISEIREICSASDKSIRTHLKNIMSKLGLKRLPSSSNAQTVKSYLSEKTFEFQRERVKQERKERIEHKGDVVSQTQQSLSIGLQQLSLQMAMLVEQNAQLLLEIGNLSERITGLEESNLELINSLEASKVTNASYEEDDRRT